MAQFNILTHATENAPAHMLIHVHTRTLTDARTKTHNLTHTTQLEVHRSTHTHTGIQIADLTCSKAP